jgi:hypothetical protein
VVPRCSDGDPPRRVTIMMGRALPRARTHVVRPPSLCLHSEGSRTAASALGPFR